MSISKGDIVLVNRTRVAYVLSGTKTLKLITYDDTSDSLKVFNAVPANSPNLSKPAIGSVTLHPKLQARYNLDFTTVSKGDYVEFKDSKGNQHQGFVIKGGSNPTVVYSQGDLECRGPAYMFTVIEKPVFEKDEPSPMDEWAVSKFKEYKDLSEETVAFTANITYKGKAVFSVKNDGQGGSMFLHTNVNDDYHHKLLDLFNKNVHDWSKQFGLEGEPFEIDENWVHWYATERDMGITAKAHFKKYNEDMAPYRKKEEVETPVENTVEKQEKKASKLKM